MSDLPDTPGGHDAQRDSGAAVAKVHARHNPSLEVLRGLASLVLGAIVMIVGIIAAIVVAFFIATSLGWVSFGC